jgi:hypothetical protein
MKKDTIELFDNSFQKSLPKNKQYQILKFDITKLLDLIIIKHKKKQFQFIFSEFTKK